MCKFLNIYNALLHQNITTCGTKFEIYYEGYKMELKVQAIIGFWFTSLYKNTIGLVFYLYTWVVVERPHPPDLHREKGTTPYT